MIMKDGPRDRADGVRYGDWSGYAGPPLAADGSTMWRAGLILIIAITALTLAVLTV